MAAAAHVLIDEKAVMTDIDGDRNAGGGCKSRGAPLKRRRPYFLLSNRCIRHWWRRRGMFPVQFTPGAKAALLYAKRFGEETPGKRGRGRFQWLGI